jgi:hypothetical protein
MIKSLGLEFCPLGIKEYLKKDFPNIGQSGTFITEEDIMKVQHNKFRDVEGDDNYHKE